MMDQAEKGELFRELHQIGNPFILANAHDLGSAKVLSALGAQAVATTSAGFGFTAGVGDGGQVSRDEMLDHCEDIVRAVNLPVSADLENGYADDPGGVAECVELAAEVGLVGCSIEDSSFDAAKPSYDFDVAIERVRAAVEAAEALAFEFTLCARADGVMTGSYDVKEAIRRCQAFEEVGAHVVYAPFLPSMDDLATLCASVSVPVNVLCAGSYTKFSKDDFARAGVARISYGSALANVTQRIIVEAGQAMLENGDFSAISKGISPRRIEQMLKEGGV